MREIICKRCGERSSFGSVGVLGHTTTLLLCPCRRCRRLSRLFFPLISRVTARWGGVPRGRARGPRWAGGREGRERSRRRTRDDGATSSRNNIINTPYLLAVPTLRRLRRRRSRWRRRAGELIWKKYYICWFSVYVFVRTKPSVGKAARTALHGPRALMIHITLLYWRKWWDVITNNIVYYIRYHHSTYLLIGWEEGNNYKSLCHIGYKNNQIYPLFSVHLLESVKNHNIIYYR